jgi:hypothetical protein
LTNLQEKILHLFSEIPDQEAFYLTGGTALSAFFLKHRRSNDLKKVGFKVERLRGFHSFVELSVTSDTDSTVVHFALDSPFRFEQPAPIEEIPDVKVDSLIDIATNKLLALFGRAELRDFIDIYFIVKGHFDKSELIEKAAQKDPGFDLYWLGIAMEKIDDFSDDSPDLHLLTRSCSMNQLKEFFTSWRRDILEEITKGE